MNTNQEKLDNDLKSLKYEFEIQDNVLHFSLLTSDNYDYQYCFYILRDNKPEYKGSYSALPTISYKLSKSGSYSVMYYIYKDGLRNFLLSEVKDYKKSVSISIFGSCVSRDLLEYDKDNKISLCQYVARQSIISAVSAPLMQADPVISLDSDFQRRMVEMDLLKTAFEFLKSKPSDYLVIDLIDERFPYICINGSYFTASNEGIKGCEIINSSKKHHKRITNGGLYIEGNNVDACIDIFCKKLNELYTNEKIIIHRALLVDHYMDKNGITVEFDKNHIKNNKKINCILNYMYDALVAKLPGAAVINEISEATADESHKWGLAPMHYQENYYLRVLKRLGEITG